MYELSWLEIQNYAVSYEVSIFIVVIFQIKDSK